MKKTRTYFHQRITFEEYNILSRQIKFCGSRSMPLRIVKGIVTVTKECDRTITFLHKHTQNKNKNISI